MTVLTLHNRVPHVGNGATVAFAYDYLLLAAAHLEVYVNSVLKVLGTDYTVSGIGNPAGGLVTFTIAPPSPQPILLLRVVPITQESAYPVGSKFPSKSHENSVDKLTMIAQQDKELALRTITLPPTEVVGGLNLVIPGNAAARANKFLGFDSSGNVILLSSAPVSGVANPWKLVFQNKAGNIFSLTGTTAATVVLALPDSALFQFPMLVIGVWGRWIKTTASSLAGPVIFYQAQNDAVTFANIITLPTPNRTAIATYPVYYYHHLPIAPMTIGGQGYGGGGVIEGLNSGGGVTSPSVSMWQAADVRNFATDPSPGSPRLVVSRFLAQLSLAADTFILDRIDVWGSNLPALLP